MSRNNSLPTSTDRLLAIKHLRRHAREILQKGIASADAGGLVRLALNKKALVELFQRKRPVVVAAGKAAAVMAEAFTSTLEVSARGLLASPNSGKSIDDLEWFSVGHPVPNQGSVAAGRRALELAGTLCDDELLVVLLSGGASAGLSVPVSGLTLKEKAMATVSLLESGVAIDGLNCVRKHLSAIKGGRLAIAAGGRVITLAISDVVGPVENDPAVIGSGPTTADPTSFEEALDLCRSVNSRSSIPSSVMSVLQRGIQGELEETPGVGDARLARSVYQIIGSRKNAIAGAAREARRRGFEVLVIEEPLVGEARVAGDLYVKTVARLTHEVKRPICVLSSGETTVTVTGRGRGGRNQEFSLASVATLARRFPEAVIASVGTDGVDGPTDAAGAIVDTNTPLRASAAGLERPDYYLATNDSYSFFSALDDLICIGPTNTNVGDLQIALIP